MNFEKWWDEVGSGIVPENNEDHEEHTKRVTREAWKAAQAAKEAACANSESR